MVSTEWFALSYLQEVLSNIIIIIICLYIEKILFCKPGDYKTPPTLPRLPVQGPTLLECNCQDSVMSDPKANQFSSVLLAAELLYLWH